MHTVQHQHIRKRLAVVHIIHWRRRIIGNRLPELRDSGANIRDDTLATLDLHATRLASDERDQPAIVAAVARKLMLHLPDIGLRHFGQHVAFVGPCVVLEVIELDFDGDAVRVRIIERRAHAFGRVVGMVILDLENIHAPLLSGPCGNASLEELAGARERFIEWPVEFARLAHPHLPRRRVWRPTEQRRDLRAADVLGADFVPMRFVFNYDFHASSLLIKSAISSETSYSTRGLRAPIRTRYSCVSALNLSR